MSNEQADKPRSLDALAAMVMTGEPLSSSERLRIAGAVTRTARAVENTQSHVTPIHPLVDAVRWILQDAAYKAPEQIGVVAERWIDRLRDAMTQEGKRVSVSSTTPQKPDCEGRVPTQSEMVLDMDVDAIKDAIGKAYPSLDDMTREMLWEKVDRLHGRAFNNLFAKPGTPELAALIEKLDDIEDDGSEGMPWSQEELDLILAALRCTASATPLNAERYEWLRVRGCAIDGTDAQRDGLVRRCINLDEEIDRLRRPDGGKA